MAWTLSRTGATTLELDASFNLQEYVRETAFTQNEIEGSETVVDSESIYNPAYRLVLTGILKGDDASATDALLMAIEDIATSDATDLVLPTPSQQTNTVTTNDYTVQHISTRAQRQGGGVMRVTLTFLTNYTRI